MKRLAISTFIYLIILSVTIGQTQEIKTPDCVLGGTFTIRTGSEVEEAILDNPSFLPSNNILNERSNFNFNFNVNPYIAKQINKSGMIGLELQYTFNLSEAESNFDSRKNSSHGFGIGLFYRQYIYALQSFSLFVQPSANFSHSIGKSERDAPAVEQFKSNNYSAGASLNLAYTLDKWNLFATLIGANYSYIKSRSASQERATHTTNLSLNTALSNFRFGVERRF